MKRIGVVGSMVWDTIHGRDPAQPAVEEWGGVAYALAGLDATLGADWQIVPLVKVGRDLAAPAARFLASLEHVAKGARFLEVAAANNRVTLRYLDGTRRCELMSGGVPPWTWPELGPLVADLDALYVNFLSGFEMDLATARYLRQGYRGPIYADLHSLLLGIEPDGLRVPRPLPDADEWFACFDWVQVNEEELGLLGPEPMGVAARVLARGARAFLVTVGARGAVYFTGRPIRTARVAPPGDLTQSSEQGDPTGCGDVFGATLAAALVAGRPLEDGLAVACRMAARNVTHRGAGGLRDHLTGRLSPV